MDREIETIVFDLGNYASNEKPQRNEHNTIIPFSLHYTDANLLFSYICELEEENKALNKRTKNQRGLLEEQAKTMNEAVAYIKEHSVFYEDSSWFEKAVPTELLEILDQGSEE